jgi:hypothetical protein
LAERLGSLVSQAIATRPERIRIRYAGEAFFQAQDASLFAWSSGGRSNYNALQVMLHHRATHGLTMDFNYTYSKSIDMTSDAERVSLFQGSFFGTGEVYNPFNPGQFRAVSDYDMTHQFNTNWVYELPWTQPLHWCELEQGGECGRRRLVLVGPGQVVERTAIQRAERLPIPDQLGAEWRGEPCWRKTSNWRIH